MKKRVTFLLDPSNLWIETILKNYKFGLSKRFTFKITKNLKHIKNQDFVFPMCYTKILPEKFLARNKLVLITHPSKLPKIEAFLECSMKF